MWTTFGEYQPILKQKLGNGWSILSYNQDGYCQACKTTGESVIKHKMWQCGMSKVLDYVFISLSFFLALLCYFKLPEYSAI